MTVLILPQPSIIAGGSRWITAIKFFIAKKESTKTASSKTLPESTNETIAQLVQLGVPARKAPELVSGYTKESIEQKILLLKSNKAKIRNTGAWLIKAIKEDWKAVPYEKEKEILQKKERERKIAIEKEQQRLCKEMLKKEHNLFVEELAEKRYLALSEHEKDLLWQKFDVWLLANQQNSFFRLLSESTRRSTFLIKELIQPHEKNFNLWTEQHNQL